MKFFLHKIPIFALAVSTLFAPAARAHFNWKVVLPAFDGVYYHYYTALSCNGLSCTVTGVIPNQPDTGSRIRFWRSNDGGINWEMQDPGLPRADALMGQFLIVQQIDSLNVIATGADTGLIVRTFDGGKTWQRQECYSSQRITSAHFSDSLTGILTTADSIMNIRTTTDGGRHWVIPPFGVANNIQNSLNGYGNISQSHAYGKGKFRLYKAPYGPIYLTNDNWKSVDSTPIFFDTSQTNPKWYFEYLFGFATFSDIGDTVLAYGVNYYKGAYPGDGLIMRSLNGGYSWESPFSSQFHNRMVQLQRTTSLDHGEILVGGLGGDGLTNSEFYLSSRDGGLSWAVDSLTDTIAGGGYNCRGLDWAAPDNPLGIFINVPAPRAEGVVFRGERVKSKVETYEYIINNTAIYPNPASSEITITTVEALRPIHIYDILGREVFRAVLTSQGKLMIDISALPKGMYSVMLDHLGKLVPIGKVAVVGK